MKKCFLYPLLFLTVILSSCGNQTYKGDFENDVREFSGINQDGKKVSISDYEGKFWIADFIFTSCVDACPVLTANMSRLQQLLKDEGIDVQLVSFSVDPKVDTPEVLTEFANYHGADLSNWDFYTGYSISEIEKFASYSFKVWATQENGVPIHANFFHLVTPEGKHIKNYQGMYPSQLDEIVKDLKEYMK